MTKPAIEVIGDDELAKVLGEFAPRVANNLGRAVIHGIASEIAKRSKRNVPIRTGNLKKAIKAKRRRSKPGKPISDVISTEGRNAKHDGFYWRFVEFGTSTGMPEMPFMRPARQEVSAQMPRILEQQFKKKLIAAVNREKKRKARGR